MEEYGCNVFQITTVAAARPGCAPYEGKFYSWNNTSGVVRDINGNVYTYAPISSTTYGEPAGIFGINCHHSYNMVFDGAFVPRYEPIETEAERKANDAAYERLQEQRRLEREVRYAKRSAEIAHASNDEEGFKRASLSVDRANTRLREYVAANNLDFNVYNTQVYGYNKAISTAVRKSAAASSGSWLQTGARIVDPHSDAAEAHAKRYYGLVRSMKTDARQIAKNTGYPEEAIREIKSYLFIDPHDLEENGYRPFFPDFAIAQSWQRLIDGRSILPHDLTLLRHETAERELVKRGLSQSEAHDIVSRKLDYGKEAEDYYADLKKHRNRRRIRGS